MQAIFIYKQKQIMAHKIKRFFFYHSILLIYLNFQDKAIGI